MSMWLQLQSDLQYFKPHPNLFSVVFTRLFLLVQRAATHRSVTGSRDRYTQALASCFTRRWKEWKSSSVRNAAPGNLAGRWNKTSKGSRETEERRRRQEQQKHWSVVQFVCTNWLQFLHLSATTHQTLCVCVCVRVCVFFVAVFFSSKAASLFLAQ